MHRHKEQALTEWHQQKKRKPLILRGARQVGKSTLIRLFAQNNHHRLHEVNLERYPSLNRVFSSNNPSQILQEIEFTLNISINTETDILFLDEIQASPKAIPALRYFYEELPELAVIAAGSLLEFTLSQHHFSMPVGRVEYLFLGPMTFKELLRAKKQEKLIELMETFQLKDYFPIAAHELLLSYLKEYIYIGGMPEAVQASITKQKFDRSQTQATQKIQSSIIETYKDDFAKYCTQHTLARVQLIYKKIPQLVGRKVKYVNIDPDAQSREIKAAIALLCKAGLFTPAYHSDADGIPLSAQQDEKIYKLFFLDIGLLNRSAKLDWPSIQNLPPTQLVNEGALAEQFIAQHLLQLSHGYETPCIHYWLREKKQTNAEVDFLWQANRNIYPIEVKSGKSGSLRSLHQFAAHKPYEKAIKFDMNLPNLQQTEHKVNVGKDKFKPTNLNLLSLPLYMVEELPRLLKNLK